ncbi:hypothetical protein DS909_15060 [Phaeobacter gallaeciensis]|uniref:Uncharacterized protein n=1 Tax=Phaeobacter gallaeciensis TaxID=60890 RepID=A0A366WT84_9RHOB|nr:hypothetical protein DS909_15060 [Phaeobacter gallaeciensis]
MLVNFLKAFLLPLDNVHNGVPAQHLPGADTLQSGAERMHDLFSLFLALPHLFQPRVIKR